MIVLYTTEREYPWDLGGFPNAAAYLDCLRSRPSSAAISRKTSLEDSGGRGNG